MYEIFKDENGKISSSRAISISTLLLFLFIGFCNVYFGTEPNEGICDIIKVIMGMSLGSIAARSTAKNLGNFRTQQENNL